MKYFSLVLLTLFSYNAFARRAAVPLMPPKEDSAQEGRTFADASAKEGRTFASSVKYSYREQGESRTLLGVEFGAIARKSSSKADLLGMQFLVGGRALAIIHLSDRWSVKPSFGYFTRSESVASVKVTQQNFEAGLSAQYQVLSRKGLAWLVGLSQRLDLSQSSITVLSSSGKTPSSLLYRIGPATGLAIDIGDSMKLLTDLEFSFLIATPSRLYSGITAGIAFGL